MTTLLAEPNLDESHPQLGVEGVSFLKIEEAEITPTLLIHDMIQVDGIDLKYTGEFPEAHIYDGWATLEPGFGGFKQTSRSLRHALAQVGIAAFTYEPTRKDSYSWRDRLTNSQEVHTRTIGALVESVENNASIKKTMPGGQTIDFSKQLHVPHSMGGLAVAPHAENQPTKVDAIINLAAAGFGSPTLPKLAEMVPVGLGHAVRHELLPYIMSGELSLSPINLARIINYYSRNPARTIGEMLACLQTDIRPTVEKLSSRGVKNAYIAFEHDCLVPPNDEVEKSVDHYHVMPDAGHMAPQLKAQQVAHTVVSTLKDLT